MAVDGRGNYVFSASSVFLSLFFTHCVLCGDRTLRMVNVVYRHGDRSPIHVFAKDMHKDYWPQGFGQLTQIGMQQEYKLGKFFRRRYIDEYKLLNSSYLFKEMYCRSSDRDRCIMSAQTQLNGLYPPHGKQVWRENLDWQPIGIHVVPRNEDYLLRPFDYPCPRLKQLEEQSKHDSEYKQVAEEYKDVIEYVSANTGQKLNLSNIGHIYDTLFCEKSHNLTLPAWATNGTTMEALKNLSNFYMKWKFNSHEKQRLTGGNLVGAMVNNMKRYLTPPSKDNIARKIYIYSAHDTTVTSLLSALKVYDGITPAYSSAVMLELFSDEENKKGDLTVRIVYRYGQSDEPRIIKLPNCTDYCSLDDFIKQTDDVIPKDLLKECNTGGGNKCVTTLVYKSFLSAFLVVTGTLILLVTCLCIGCCRRRWRRRQAKLGVVYNDLLKDARLLDKSDYDSDS